MSRTISKIGTTSTGTQIPQIVTYGEITLDKIEAGQYQKAGTITAQIRQKITTVSSYPNKQVSSNMQQGLYDTSDFGFSSQDFVGIETRVAWIPVPANSTTAEVQAKLNIANANGATIYRVMHNHPILDNNQKNAVRIGLGGVTLDTFANSQIVRYPTTDQHLPNEGQICLDSNGKVQYRRTFFYLTPVEDQDLRTIDPADVYVSPEIQLELAAGTPGVPASTVIPDVLQGQTL